MEKRSKKSRSGKPKIVRQDRPSRRGTIGRSRPMRHRTITTSPKSGAKAARRTRRLGSQTKASGTRHVQKGAPYPQRKTSSSKTARKRSSPKTKRISDRRFQFALKLLQEGKTVNGAAREIGVSPQRLERQLRSTRAARKRQGRWIVRADLPRQILLFSTHGALIVQPRNRYQASKGARFMGAAGRALVSNEPTELETFQGKSLTDAQRRKWFFETDLDRIYRLASTGDETFESVYRIVI